MHSLTIVTRTRCVAMDITGEVEQLVRKSGVTEGVCHISVPHTTAGVFVNERDDPAVAEDLTAWLERVAPHVGPYKHDEGNTDSHIKAVLTGNSVSLPVTGGWLTVGRWQGVFLAEFDGPRTRTVNVILLKA